MTQAREVLRNEPKVLQISSPVIIVGDIHGQFFDLLEIFKIAGKPPVRATYRVHQLSVSRRLR
jgi:hypothetical protein